MIRSFRHAGPERFFKTGSKAGIPPAHAGKLYLQLAALGVAKRPADLSVPSWKRHVARATLSGILNGSKGISPEMSRRLARALGTYESFWLDMQAHYDLWQAKKKKLPPIEPFFQAA